MIALSSGGMRCTRTWIATPQPIEFEFRKFNNIIEGVVEQEQKAVEMIVERRFALDTDKVMI